MHEQGRRRRIGFSEGFVELIRSGKKQITFRAGRRRFKAGEIVEGRCAEGVTVLLQIKSCVVKSLGEVTEQEARDDLFESREAVLSGMRRFYPNMTWDSEVSLIRFEVVSKETD